MKRKRSSPAKNKPSVRRHQMVKKLLEEGWYKKAVELLDDGELNDQETYRMVISGLPEEHFKEIDQAVCKMRQHGCTLDSGSFKKLFHLVRRPGLMINCYKEMVAQCSTSADEEVCQAVLDVMVLKRRLEEACELVKQMVAWGFKPRNLQSLFAELVRAGKLKDAYNMLASVDSEEAHNDLIVSLGAGEADEIVELVKQMLGRGYKPCVRPVFEGLLAAGRDEDAYDALKMVGGGEEAHCEFIGAVIKLGRFGDAYQFVENMIRRHVGEQVEERCFNKLVHGLFEYHFGDKPRSMLATEIGCGSRLDNKMETIVRAFDLMALTRDCA